MIAGVCGGLGRALGIDPVIFRITLAVLAVFGGIGLLLYGVGWLLIPEEGTDESEGARLVHGRTSLATLAAIALGIIGLIFVADLAGARLSHGLPLLLVVAVLAALIAARRPGATQAFRSPNRAVLVAVAVVAGVFGLIAVLALSQDFFHWSRNNHAFGYGPNGRAIGTLFFLVLVIAVVSAVAVALRSRPEVLARWRRSAAGSTPVTEPVSRFDYPAATSTAPLGPPAGFSPSRPLYEPWTPPPAPPKAPRDPSFLVPLTLSVGAIAVGVLLVLGASGQLDVTVADLFGAALLATGLGLVIATWFGRGRALIPVGIVLAAGLVIAATVNVPLRGGIGSRNIAASSVNELQSNYQLGVGKQDIDLHNLILAGHTAHVKARLGVGQLFISVPDNVKVVVHAHAGAGQTNVFDVEQDGTSIDHTTTAAAGPPQETGRPQQVGELDLDVRVGVGDIDVVRQWADSTATAIVPPPAIPEPSPVPQVAPVPESSPDPQIEVQP
jgi:phage shock protein PspC (stress-responsive transcriptional regulator)